jgi:alpha-N-arabinofuranosidase
MLNARITLDASLPRVPVDNRLFGAFIEHLGRAIYGGVYEPGHPKADADGFRGDVLELVRELRVPIIRYPGGNFVSAYRWEDGVGPRENRPKRLDLAWRSVEPNLVGVNEFARWARKAGGEVMMALNLGTRDLEDAKNLVEYCNHPAGTYWSDLRRAHGAREPHKINVWCLGNEMDGPWQVGQKTAEEYGKLARETAKALKLFDPGLELVACGSSGPGMPTFPSWEATVLERCARYVDFISLHMYARKKNDDAAEFLAESARFERYINTVERLTDAAAAKAGSSKRIMLSVDEWNVWYHSEDADKRVPPWTIGPPLLEDVYTLEDALAVGCFLIVLLRHADRVKMACLAQLINVIAPIMTSPGGPAWRQTIFYPFLHASRYGRGEALHAVIESPGFEVPDSGAVGWLEAAAVLRPADDELTLFAVNRKPDDPLTATVRLGGFGGCRVIEHIVLSHPDPQAVNDRDHPGRITPGKIDGARIEKESLRAVLPPYSWNVIRIGATGRGRKQE